MARAVHLRQASRVKSAEERARQSERLAEIGAMTGGLAARDQEPAVDDRAQCALIAEGVAEIKGGPGDEDVKPRLINRVGALAA